MIWSYPTGWYDNIGRQTLQYGKFPPTGRHRIPLVKPGQPDI